VPHTLKNLLRAKANS